MLICGRILMLLGYLLVKRRKPKAHRKDEMLRIRVTAAQKRLLIAAAERDALDVSAWLRQLGLRAASGEPKPRG